MGQVTSSRAQQGCATGRAFLKGAANAATAGADCVAHVSSLACRGCWSRTKHYQRVRQWLGLSNSPGAPPWFGGTSKIPTGPLTILAGAVTRHLPSPFSPTADPPNASSSNPAWAHLDDILAFLRDGYVIPWQSQTKGSTRQIAG